MLIEHQPPGLLLTSFAHVSGTGCRLRQTSAHEGHQLTRRLQGRKKVLERFLLRAQLPVDRAASRGTSENREFAATQGGIGKCRGHRGLHFDNCDWQSEPGAVRLQLSDHRLGVSFHCWILYSGLSMTDKSRRHVQPSLDTAPDGLQHQYQHDSAVFTERGCRATCESLIDDLVDVRNAGFRPRNDPGIATSTAQGRNCVGVVVYGDQFGYKHLIHVGISRRK